MKLHLSLLLAFSLAFPAPAQAEPGDAAAARELLKRGYALKKQGKYAAALEPLLESVRLDSQVKTLMNVADCEEQLGQLGQAQKHWILARDAAAQQGSLEAQTEVERRLAELEARMPKLRLQLTSDVPGQEVRRDGVLLSQAALEIALPADPGEHQIVVSAPGHEEGRFSVTLAERDAKSLAVYPGAALPARAAAESPPEAPAPIVPAPIAPPRARAPHSPVVSLGQRRGDAPGFWKPQRIAAVGLAGLGSLALGVAALEWMHAKNLHDEALDTCRPVCTSEGHQKQAEAVDAVKLTNLLLISGGVLVAGGAALWLTVPGASTKAGLAPVVSPRTAGLGAFGTF